MKAMVRDVYGLPDVLEFRDVEKPVPGPGEALVRVEAASVNTADLEHLRGEPRAARVATGWRRPRRKGVGFDVAGRVEAVGDEVRSLQPGDAVWADLFDSGGGAFAEWVSAPQEVFSPIPAGVPFDQAATIPHSAILALQGLTGRGPIEPGQTVLVIGAGGCVGPFAIQLAKAFGAEVTGVDHTGKLELMRTAGADHVIDYTKEDFAENGLRYDMILDIAAQRSLYVCRRSLAPRGRHALIARSIGGLFGAAVVGAGISIAGSKRMGVFMWKPNNREDLVTLGRLLAAGEIKPLIDRSYPLSETPAALRYVDQGHARGKVIITV
ncbi:MAG TPA: NAD(P)-dependent alcohol dehydrogenase [Acidimicrobiia bacterium]|nr:NAD(P)-dependent alcohol dehydrogenase [Acidimicrobiia bacterium]